jgi:hypothetical protein
MMLALLVPQHGPDMDVVYFWSSVLIALLPLGVFTTITVLVVRGYFHRAAADGGGEPPPPRAPRRPWRVVLRAGSSTIHR